MNILARTKPAFNSGTVTLFNVTFYDADDPANSGVTGPGVTPVVDPTNWLMKKDVTIQPGTTDTNVLLTEVQNAGKELKNAIALKGAFNGAVPANFILGGF